jgi:uncharacterized protein YeaO (DUF488 family)
VLQELEQPGRSELAQNDYFAWNDYYVLSAAICKTLARRFAYRMPVTIKRAYEKPVLSDGQRILVDRLWPRGVKKETARIDHWLKALAPSDALRVWFHASQNWAIFKKRYFKELCTQEATEALNKLYELLDEYSDVTLIYASANVEQNNAVALKELLEGMKKPPSSSGPAKAAALPGRMTKRRPGSRG